MNMKIEKLAYFTSLEEIDYIERRSQKSETSSFYAISTNTQYSSEYIENSRSAETGYLVVYGNQAQVQFLAKLYDESFQLHNYHTIEKINKDVAHKYPIWENIKKGLFVADINFSKEWGHFIKELRKNVEFMGIDSDGFRELVPHLNKILKSSPNFADNIKEVYKILKRLDSEMIKLSNDKTYLEDDIEEMRRQIDMLESECSELQDQVTDLENDNIDLRNKIDNSNDDPEV